MHNGFDPDLARQLEGERLVLAEITYRFPDFQSLLHTFVWQSYDKVPELPKFYDFLEYWIDEIEGPLHSVRYIIQGLVIVPTIPVLQTRHRIDL